MKTAQVTVFGSINMDLAVKVPYLPKRGETLAGHSFLTTPGGKGANQAVALSKLGVETALIGRVGNDDFGHRLRQDLADNGVHVEAISIDKQASTGIAIITVEESGENEIIIVAGANEKIDDSDLNKLEKLLANSSYLLLQLEIPLVAVVQAIKIAQKFNISVILDPAPATKLPDEIYSQIKILTPNIIEVSQLVDFPVRNIKEVEKAGSILLNKGVENVIITMGEKGVFCANCQEKFLVYAPVMNVIDTVAAGDAFNGGLTAALVKGYSLPESVTWGVIAGSLSVTKTGAQSSLPSLQEFAKAQEQMNVIVKQLS